MMHDNTSRGREEKHRLEENFLQMSKQKILLASKQVHLKVE